MSYKKICKNVNETNFDFNDVEKIKKDYPNLFNFSGNEEILKKEFKEMILDQDITLQDLLLACDKKLIKCKIDVYGVFDCYNLGKKVEINLHNPLSKQKQEVYDELIKILS